jgi:hypothetical protein
MTPVPQKLLRYTICLLLLLAGVSPTLAAELSAGDQLPETTVAYLKIQNTRELVERSRQTALGLAFQDPQVRPLIEHLWSSVVPTLKEFEEKMGMTLDEVVAAAPGQLVLALVGVPSSKPAVVVMFRPERPDELEKTLARGEGRLTELGFAASADTIEGAEARILTIDDGPVQEVIQLRLQDWRMITTDRQVAGALVLLWRGQTLPSLSGHNAFRAIMARCSPEGSSSQIDWYVDPIGVFRAFTRDSFVTSTGMAFLSAIGADGLQGIGGRITLADEEYDLITRSHILLEPPRDGALQLLALRQGSSEPEAWVPSDAAQYVTWQWDLQQAFSTLKELVDSLRGDGALAEMVKRRLSEPLGVDFQQDVLPLLAGRISQVVRFEQPASMTSQSMAVGMELTDRDRFAEQWTRIVAKHADSIEQTSFAGIDVYQWKRSLQPDGPADEQTEGQQDKPAPNAPDEREDAGRRRRQQQRRQPWQQAKPVAALVGNYLVVADRMSLLQHIVMTYDDAQPRLKDELDYKLVMSKLKRHSTTTPGMFRFERPEEGLRMMYQLLQTEDLRRQIHEQRERHPFFKAVDEMLTENRLPDFAVLAQYLAPGGSMLVNEESGFYHVGFGLRRQIQQP